MPNASDSRLVLLPAVDVAGGQAVQLVQGRAGSERRFGDPRAAAERWQAVGAEWIHLVDLDAAFGRGDNLEILTELTTHLRINVELSGGIRDDASLERTLATTGLSVAAQTRRSRSVFGPDSMPSALTSVTTNRAQPARSSRSSASIRSPPSRVQPRAASRLPRTSSPTAIRSP